MVRTSPGLKWLAWGLAGSAIAFQVAAIPLLQDVLLGPLSEWVVYIVSGLGLAGVGLVVSTKRSRNPVGWLLLGSGWLLALASLLEGYAITASAGSGNPQLGSWAAWAIPLTFSPAFGSLLLLLPLLFPDGRLLSPRWKVVLWGALVGIAAWSLSGLLDPNLETWELYPGLSYPLPFVAPSWMIEMLTLLGGPLVIGPVAVAVLVHLIIRFRRSRGVERQQFKWLLFPACIFLAFIVLNELVGLSAEGLAGALATALFLFGFGGLPVGVGIAVMRYRLYDIDRIISRTVSYTLVVAVLALLFFGVVTVLTSLVPTESDLAVAGSTLAVAALFNPLRRRVQRWVDRRFNRARYDAQHEIDTMTARLQEAHELAEITDQVVGVVTKTMEPSAVGVWVRES